MNTPILMTQTLLLAALLAFSPAARAAEDCEAAKTATNRQMDELKSQRENANDDDTKILNAQILDLARQQTADVRACESRNKTDQDKAKDLAKQESDCNAKAAQYKDVYSWDAKRKKCVNKADTAASRSPTDSDECSSASVFTDLKGGNCKKAMNVVKDVRARNDAVTGATQAATIGYTNYQVQGATGAQDDSQTRQANMMKMMAMSKFASGLVSMAGAAQLKSAASGAEDASSTISGASKSIQAACANADDDQACFYQNSKKFGITADAANYATYSRMKTGAQQSQDQADAANSLAKSAMLSGAADVLVGMQAMKAAQMANQNAGQMAPPPMFMPPPPPQRIALGDMPGTPGAPSMDPAGNPAPMDGGAPTSDLNTFGAQHKGRIDGALKAGNFIPGAGFKGAASGVSGGGGGGGGLGGGGLRPSGPGGKQGSGRRNSTAGEYVMGGGGKGGSPGGEKGGEKDNPLADMLAKMFPQGQDGKTVVDMRQVASAAGGTVEEEQGEAGVTAADLSIFEQISAKYRQLKDSGRF